MSNYIYPRAPEPVPEPTQTEADAATILISLREAGVSRRMARCKAIKGAGDVALVNKVDAEIEAERKAMEAVNVCEYDTITAYKNALQEHQKWLSLTTWADYLKQKYDVTTFADLKAKLCTGE